MDFGCCANEEGRGIDGMGSSDLPNSIMTMSEESEDSFDDQANTLQSDYNIDCTPLFKAIEQEDWKGVLVFLTTGRWGSSALTSSFNHLHDRPAEHQVRTWVTCNEKNGATQWRQLPIHAAISYQAPLPVIQKLVGLHHDGLRSGDDTGNLPLHLAFGFGSPDNVVAFLIKEYPQALSVRGLQARFPIDCCDLGSNKHRAEIIRACQEHTRTCMMRDWDRHWKRSLLDAKKKAGLKEQYSVNNKTLEEVFSELMQVKIELEKTKQLAKNRPTMIITKTEPVPLAPKSLSRTPSEMSKRFTFARTGSKLKLGRTMKRFLPPLSTSSASVAPSMMGNF